MMAAGTGRCVDALVGMTGRRHGRRVGVLRGRVGSGGARAGWGSAWARSYPERGVPARAAWSGWVRCIAPVGLPGKVLGASPRRAWFGGCAGAGGGGTRPSLGRRFGAPGLRRFMPATSLHRQSLLRRCKAPSRGEGRARPGLAARAFDFGRRGAELGSVGAVGVALGRGATVRWRRVGGQPKHLFRVVTRRWKLRGGKGRRGPRGGAVGDVVGGGAVCIASRARRAMHCGRAVGSGPQM